MKQILLKLLKRLNVKNQEKLPGNKVHRGNVPLHARPQAPRPSAQGHLARPTASRALVLRRGFFRRELFPNLSFQKVFLNLIRKWRFKLEPFQHVYNTVQRMKFCHKQPNIQRPSTTHQITSWTNTTGMT